MMVDREKCDTLLGLLAGYVRELRRLAAVPAAERFRSPTDSADAFTVLVERGICPPEMEDSLRAMARFRNRLVHVYWHIDDALVAEYLQSRPMDFDRFTVCVARLL